MTYRESREYLREMSALGSVPGLESITELCRRIGNPQDTLFFVHIAGTNGKGSVLAFLSSILKTAGYRTGCFFSPEVLSYRSRISVNGKPILAREFAEMMDTVRGAADGMAAEGLSHPTVFEMETAAAFLYFQKRECDIVVLECGMGGKLDATNLIRNTLVAVITSVSMDHMGFLGKTLPEIAAQKAGIIKPGAIAVSAAQEEEALAALKKHAAEGSFRIVQKSRLTHVRYGLKRQSFDYQTESGRCYQQLLISLAGVVQPENAALAVETAEALREKGFPVTESALRRGLLKANWPCRFEVVKRRPDVILDGAHNEDGARRLAESIRFYFTNRRIIYIIGILKDKEYEKIIAETYAYAEQIITLTPPDTDRALSAHELAAAAALYHPRVTEAGSVEEAVEMAYLFAKKDWVIIAFGSLSYMGALHKVLESRGSGHGRSGKSKTGNRSSVRGNR